jgi:hypothetical protein
MDDQAALRSILETLKAQIEYVNRLHCDLDAVCKTMTRVNPEFQTILQEEKDIVRASPETGKLLQKLDGLLDQLKG